MKFTLSDFSNQLFIQHYLNPKINNHLDLFNQLLGFSFREAVQCTVNMPELSSFNGVNNDVFY